MKTKYENVKARASFGNGGRVILLYSNYGWRVYTDYPQRSVYQSVLSSLFTEDVAKEKFNSTVERLQDRFGGASTTHRA